jgi:hypothetical protein
MTQLTPQQIKQLQDKFLGKRIKVPIQKRADGMGSYNSTVTGDCQFIGYNPMFPSFGLQVTLDRMPITNVDHTKIKLV